MGRKNNRGNSGRFENQKLQKIALRKKLYTKSTLHKKHIAQKSLKTKGKMNEVTSQTSFITQLDSQVNVNSYLVDLDEKLLGSEKSFDKNARCAVGAMFQ